MTDTHALIARCREGDDLAWERLVRDHQRRVYAVAYQYVFDPDEARDLAQEAFVRVYQKLSTFDGGAFVPWLIRIVRNLCVDHLRRRQARPPASDVPVEGEGQTLPLADERPGPDVLYLRDRKRRLVHDALRLMAGPEREVIVLKEIQGLKFREIADLLGLPIGTIKSRSNRARLQLAERVAKLDPTYAAGVRAGSGG